MIESTFAAKDQPAGAIPTQGAKFSWEMPGFVPSGTVAEKHWPPLDKLPHGSLKRGDSVWYRGERMFVEFVNDHWSKGVYARICDQPVRPPPFPLPSDEPNKTLTTFCVHVGCLSMAPPVRGAALYTGGDSLAVVERKERAKQGITDIGDEVALLLRKAKDLDDVYRIGAKYLREDEEYLRKRFGHLNNGQQRMQIGNRMRNKMKKEVRK